MKYFELKKEIAISQPLELIEVPYYNPRMTQEELKLIKKLKVGYFKNNIFIQYSDILWQPSLLLSDAMKNVFEMYDKQIEFKAIQLFSKEEGDNRNYLYWWPYIPFVDCLSDETKTYTTGTLELLVLDKQKLENKHILYVKGILENKLIISMAVAESLLRRPFVGFTLTPVLLNEQLKSHGVTS